MTRPTKAPDERLIGALPTGRDTVPIHRARRHLAASLIEGTTCPVCGQNAQLYRRKISGAMVRDLVTLYRASDGTAYGYEHVPTLGVRGGDFAKLAHWGLIAAKPERRGDGGHAGYWRVTADGVAFVEGRARVPMYVLIYDGEKIGFDGEQVGIDAVAGDGFDLRDVRAERVPPADDGLDGVEPISVGPVAADPDPADGVGPVEVVA